MNSRHLHVHVIARHIKPAVLDILEALLMNAKILA